MDSTNISSILLKSLLSHIDTKQDLTVYLAKKSKSEYEAVNQQHVVTYDKISKSNIESFPDVMKTHDHEETDTLLILHCFNIARRDPFTACTVYSPDTGVLLLLTHFYPSLPQSLLFHTEKGKDARKIHIESSYEGPGHAQGLLRFHVFTGCNETGSFSRKSKTFWWKKFQRANKNTLDAFAKLGEKFIATFSYNLHCETCVL